MCHWDKALIYLILRTWSCSLLIILFWTKIYFFNYYWCCIWRLLWCWKNSWINLVHSVLSLLLIYIWWYYVWVKSWPCCSRIERLAFNLRHTLLITIFVLVSFNRICFITFRVHILLDKWVNLKRFKSYWGLSLIRLNHSQRCSMSKVLLQ